MSFLSVVGDTGFLFCFFFFFVCTFVMWPYWWSPTRGISQIWLQAREESTKTLRNLLIFWQPVRAWNPLSKYGNSRIFSPQNLVTFAHYFHNYPLQLTSDALCVRSFYVLWMCCQLCYFFFFLLLESFF